MTASFCSYPCLAQHQGGGGTGSETHEQRLARVKQYGLLQGLEYGQVDLSLPLSLRVSEPTVWALRAYVADDTSVFAALNAKVDALSALQDTEDTRTGEALDLNVQDIFKAPLGSDCEVRVLGLLLAHLRHLLCDMQGARRRDGLSEACDMEGGGGGGGGPEGDSGTVG